MNMKFLSKALLMAAASFMLAACAGNAPAPVTDAQPEEGTQALLKDTTLDAGQTAAQNTATVPSATTPASSDAQAATHAGVFDSQALDSYRLNTPENTPATSDVGPADNTQSSSAAAQVPDPYTAFPKLVEEVFAHAASLYKAGLTDSASAYLEKFRILKPMWKVWFDKADTLLNEFGKERAEKAKAFEPLVFQIQNMNRAQTAYSMVAETADSLIALAPGDSLTGWANAQKQIAYKNTLAKAKKEYDSIKALADNQATIDQYAPLTYVRPDAPPIVIISGDRELELYGRYEEQAYFWRMLKLVGHKDVTLYEMQGYNHGEMPQPAYKILKDHIRRLTAGK